MPQSVNPFAADYVAPPSGPVPKVDRLVPLKVVGLATGIAVSFFGIAGLILLTAKHTQAPDKVPIQKTRVQVLQERLPEFSRKMKCQGAIHYNPQGKPYIGCK